MNGSRVRLAAMFLVALAFAMPFLWMLSTSFETQEDALDGGIWPTSFHPENYAAVAERIPIALQALNTTFVTLLTVIGTVLSCSLVGYAFARLRFPGRDLLFLLTLSSMMLPPQVTMIPHFMLFKSLGWIDSFLPLVVPAFVCGNGFSAFFIFMYRQFYLTLPTELEEAARLDGCGFLGTWWRILFPLTLPASGTCAVFAFVWTWNDFLYPLIFLQSPGKHTLALGLASFRGSQYGLSEVHVLMAASVLTILPCLLLFFFAQRLFLRSLTAGAIKG